MIETYEGELLRNKKPFEIFVSTPRPYEYSWSHERLPEKSSKILDIGCAMGSRKGCVEQFCKVICEEGYNVTGIDIMDKDWIGWSHPNFTFFHENITHNSLPSETFDFVVSFQAWHHIGIGYLENPLVTKIPNGDEVFINEIYRVLKKGGKAVITTLIEPSLPCDDWQVFTMERIKQLLVDKFKILEIGKKITVNTTLLLYLEKY